ncbi:MAG: aminotransferase class IV [Cloacibacterium sp.]|jgi:branched-subunit amino acid aminotransferase/4-amino-4-deoxychorismate lyase|nr:aminotransferase class IV [Cloacibacterium sp.]MBP8060404.1 aminotransferase class IV [Cloacibacterium sp.]MBP8085094.1 aminotransferase class IV [Cloacibacterium sp.]
MRYIDGEKNTDKAFQNNAFLYGDAVKVHFYIKNSQLIMAEECYFFLMASMRKMRMNIPLSFTLEFFSDIFLAAIAENQIQEGVIELLAYRNRDDGFSAKTPVHFYFEIRQKDEVLKISEKYELDLMKEISVNTNVLSNIKVHSPENIYAEIYAKENDLDDVIFLNPNKKIARTIYGNLLLLEENTIKIPKQTEGAYISPLMENFVTFVHKNNLATIEEAELSAFESQKAEEILVISDEKGIFTVSKIRNKEFGNERYKTMLEAWKTSF